MNSWSLMLFLLIPGDIVFSSENYKMPKQAIWNSSSTGIVIWCDMIQFFRCGVPQTLMVRKVLPIESVVENGKPNGQLVKFWLEKFASAACTSVIYGCFFSCCVCSRLTRTVWIDSENAKNQTPATRACGGRGSPGDCDVFSSKVTVAAVASRSWNHCDSVWFGVICVETKDWSCSHDHHDPLWRVLLLSTSVETRPVKYRFIHLASLHRWVPMWRHVSELVNHGNNQRVNIWCPSRGWLLV